MRRAQALLVEANLRDIASHTQSHITTQPMASSHYVQGIHLPRANKAAYTSKALLEWQRNLATHDAALQVLLMAILRAAQHITMAGDLQLPDLEFVINFATPSGEREKRFVVKMRKPFHEDLEITQAISAHTCATYWRVYRPGNRIFCVEAEGGGISEIHAPEEDLGAGRTRIIQLD